MILLLGALILASCGGDGTDNKIILGENYGGNANFYTVAEQSCGELEILHVQYKDGVVLFTTRNYLTGEVGVSTYNIYTGARTGHKKSTVASALAFKSGFLQDGAIYTFDGASNALTLYDGSLAETQKTNLVNINVGELYVTREYVFCISEGALFRVNTKNNSAERLFGLDGLTASSLRFLGASGNELYVTGYDDAFVDKLIVCDMKSGECKELGVYDGKLLLRDGIASLGDYSEKKITVYDLERPDILSTIFLTEEDEQLIGAGKGKVCTSLIEGEDLVMTQTLRVFSLHNGAPEHVCRFEYDLSLDQTNIREVFVVDDDFVLFEAVTGKTSRIVLWKYSDSEARKTEHAFLPVSSGEEAHAKENEKTADELGEKYGVNIILGDEAVRYYPDYVAVPENGVKEIRDALLTVRKTLAKYPEGFFAELIEKGAHDSLNIVLCKKLVPTRPGELSSADGYFVELDGQYILLTASGDIENTLSHEVMHAAETAMHLYSHDEFSEWGSYNPEGFEYANSYVDESGREYGYDTLGEYTPYDPKSVLDPDNVAFFDYYSKTFAKEDRARVFEMLMKDELSPYFERGSLASKAAYLIERLDAFFESAKKDENAYWKRIAKQY